MAGTGDTVVDLLARVRLPESYLRRKPAALSGGSVSASPSLARWR